MTRQNEFDDPDNGLGFLGSIGPKAAFFIVLIALSFMIGLVWKLYTGGGSDKGDVPIVRADTEGFKVTPEDPGGMEVKFQDSTLFSGDSAEGVENLLADDTNEKPMPRSQLFAGLNTDDESTAIENIELSDNIVEDEQRIVEQAREAEAVIEDLNENGADAIVITEEIVVEDKPEPTPEPTVVKEELKPTITFEAPAKVEPPRIEVKEEPIAAEVPKIESEPVTVASGDYFVQLASVQSKEAAEKEWDNFVKKYRPLLNGVSHRVETADLGAKGVYHRIQAGPIAKASADNICSGIKTKGGSCLVKKK
ncbi:MAG: SPOR domain-containing protein [Pseudomonadota bacterium]